MKLTTLEIHRYRGVAPDTALAFSPSMNLVLGENGSGRTMLLDLISLVLASDFSGLLQEEFSLAYGITFPGMRIRVTVRNEKRSAPAEPDPGSSALLPLRSPEVVPELHPSIEMELQLEEPATRLVVRADASGLAAEVDGQTHYSQGMRWSLLDRSLWVVLFMTAQYLDDGLKDRLKALLRHTFLLGPSRFDEGLGAFEQIGKIRYVMQVRGGEVFPLGLMALPTWLPGHLHQQVARAPSAGVFELHHHEVPRSFLARFVALAGFTSGTLRWELLEKQVFGDGERLELGQFGFTFTRRDGSVLSHGHLGYGQKRLLSFLYYLDINEDFVVADELANGLSPRWVQACLRELGDRQVFLTSQNPLLFEHVPLGSAEDIRASLVLCGAGLREGREQLVWSDPTEELAGKLFSAYRTGGTPLGDLLRAHGLW